MAADTYMSVCIQRRLSLKTKTTIQGEHLNDVMGTDEGQDFSVPWVCFFLFWSMCLCVCMCEHSRSSLYQCHGGCQANERGLSLEQEGLGCAIHSAYLNAL